MKKYGKYDKKPKAKSILLQTYFTSLLSLVLCVAMFLGTSYAWFVSEVNNTGNEIYIGILDVELEKKTGEDKWESLSATKEDGSSKITLFNNEIRWEPGVTQLETVKVINKGDQLRYGSGVRVAVGIEAELEVELESEDEELQLPDWIEVIREVSADKRYTNSALAKEIPDEEI